MRILRDGLAALLLFVSFVALLLSAPAGWVRANVVDENGFVNIAGGLASDEALQKTLAENALSQFAPDLPIPQAARDLVEKTVAAQVPALTNTDTYATIWTASVRDLHGQLFTDGPVTLKADLGPLWDALAEPVDSVLPFGIELPVPESTVVELATFEAPGMGTLVDIAKLADALPIIAVAAALGAVGVSRSRFATLFFAGLASLLAALAWWYLLLNHESLLPAEITGEPFAWPLAHAFFAAAYADLMPVAWWVGGAGAVLMVVAIAGAAIAASIRRARSGPDPVSGRLDGERAVRHDAYDAPDPYEA